MDTSADHIVDPDGMLRVTRCDKRMLRAHSHTDTHTHTHTQIRLTITLPLAPYLVRNFGDFVTIDATSQVTIYDSGRGPRQGMQLSVVDTWRQVHPLSYTDVCGHREGQSMCFYIYVRANHVHNRS